MAEKIAGDSPSIELLDLARKIAEAEVDVMRVRQARYDRVSRVLGLGHAGTLHASTRRSRAIVG
jgi:hypothetical protein